MRYDVILYSLHWLKYSGIDADSPRDAIQWAYENRLECDAEPEDAEDLPQEALVDVVGDYEHEHSRRYDLEFFDGQAVAIKSSETSMRDRALSLLHTLARMTIEGEELEGRPFEPSSDDEIDALYSAIRQARAILGR